MSGAGLSGLLEVEAVSWFTGEVEGPELLHVSQIVRVYPSQTQKVAGRQDSKPTTVIEMRSGGGSDGEGNVTVHTLTPYREVRMALVRFVVDDAVGFQTLCRPLVQADDTDATPHESP